jgi:hypothetical protein
MEQRIFERVSGTGRDVSGNLEQGIVAVREIRHHLRQLKSLSGNIMLDCIVFGA